MRTVIVVGAGATLAEALPARPNPATTPPLDATFFHLCSFAKLTGRDVVKKYMTSTYGIDPLNGHNTMEQIFNYIHADAVSPYSSAQCLEAYWALTLMYAEAIRTTTNALEGSSRSGVGALLRCLYRGDPAGEVVFVTFNQDLVIERSIQTTVEMTKYSHIPWNLASCYQTEFAGYLHGSRGARFTLASARPRPRSTLILKLHGSLNWVYPARSATDRQNAIRNPTTRPLLQINRVLPGSMRYTPHQRSVPLLPLIVPPIYEKTPRYRKALSPIWGAAETWLTSAERLIIFGYSFPATDLAARSLFRRCFHRNDSLREIHVIDPAPAAGATVASLTDASCTHLYRSVELFSERFADSQP